MYCVALITIALGLNGASTVVSLANALDLAPNYAATLSSIINTFSTAAGIIAPLVVSYFTSENVSWCISLGFYMHRYIEVNIIFVYIVEHDK